MRKKISYTVEESVVEEFNKICKEKAINKSALVELLILDYMRRGTTNKKPCWTHGKWVQDYIINLSIAPV